MLIQETVIEANTEDKAVGSYIRKIRESAFMTEEELKAWQESAAKDAEEEEEEGESKREKARRLVRERGLPEALRGVMGGGERRVFCYV